MNRKFINKSNFVLRKILNSQENIDILKEFIEEILAIKIEEATINPYLIKLKNKLPAEENFGIADLRIKTTENIELNVGIQIIDGKYIIQKILLYYAQIHFGQMEYEDKREITKTVTINILDCIFLNNNKYHTKLRIKEKSAGVIEDYMELNVLELPKYQSRNQNEKKEAWMDYLKGENIEKAIAQSEKIKKLENLLEEYWKKEVIE